MKRGKTKEFVVEVMNSACIVILILAAIALSAYGIETTYWQSMLTPIIWYLIGARDKLHT